MSMKIYTNGNGDPIYQLNDKSAIMSNYKFGAYVGTYIIRDIPEAYSMAVINNDISDVITYSGTSTKEIMMDLIVFNIHFTMVQLQ